MFDQFGLPKCPTCRDDLYVSEHFFFDIDGIFIGCRSCHYGNMLGSDEPAAKFAPDDDDDIDRFRAAMRDRARKLTAQKENPA